MDIVAVGDNARGVIAVGQHATGIFAFGQIATGVIAIGQVARGCVAIGQVAIGFIGWGQLGVGVLHAVGMLGIGGRGFGPVLRLVPALGKKRVLPTASSLERVQAGEPGWLLLEAFQDGHGLGLGSQGQRYPIKLHRALLRQLGQLAARGPVAVLAFVRSFGSVLVCERIVHEPPRPFQTPGWYTFGAIRLFGLLILACVWWLAVGDDLIELFDSLLA